MSNSPYDEGFQAFQDGQDLDANPHPDGSDEYYDWEGGWVTASDETPV